MAIKKSELYSSLWAGCDELRGGMDASQYKDYVLVLLFMKYVSDKAARATCSTCLRAAASPTWWR
jgi:type I restriction enzyme M protein